MSRIPLFLGLCKRGLASGADTLWARGRKAINVIERRREKSGEGKSVSFLAGHYPLIVCINKRHTDISQRVRGTSQ